MQLLRKRRCFCFVCAWITKAFPSNYISIEGHAELLVSKHTLDSRWTESKKNPSTHDPVEPGEGCELDVWCEPRVKHAAPGWSSDSSRRTKKRKKFAQPFSEGWHNKEEQGDLKKLEANMPLSLLTNRRLSFVILTSVSVMLRGGFAWLLSL